MTFQKNSYGRIVAVKARTRTGALLKLAGYEVWTVAWVVAVAFICTWLCLGLLFGTWL